MYNNLSFFEAGRIELHSLIGCLEFVFSAMESVEEEWEEQFLKEIIVLESVNAIYIIKSANEEAPEISEKQAKTLIKQSVSNLKLLVEKELHDMR